MDKLFRLEWTEPLILWGLEPITSPIGNCDKQQVSHAESQLGDQFNDEMIKNTLSSLTVNER